jgi:hypothetical protein
MQLPIRQDCRSDRGSGFFEQLGEARRAQITHVSVTSVKVVYGGRHPRPPTGGQAASGGAGWFSCSTTAGVRAAVSESADM